MKELIPSGSLQLVSRSRALQGPIVDVEELLGVLVLLAKLLISCERDTRRIQTGAESEER